jgi:hypothetical protein
VNSCKDAIEVGDHEVSRVAKVDRVVSVRSVEVDSLPWTASTDVDVKLVRLREGLRLPELPDGDVVIVNTLDDLPILTRDVANFSQNLIDSFVSGGDVQFAIMKESGADHGVLSRKSDRRFSPQLEFHFLRDIQ